MTGSSPAPRESASGPPGAGHRPGPSALPERRDGARLRLCLVISSLGGGGAERVTTALARHWHEAGHAVTVLTLAPRAGDAYDLAPGVERIALDLLRDSRNPAQGLWRAGERVVALRRALRGAGPEVVVSMMSATNVLVLLAAAGLRVPVVVCERSDPRQEVVGPYWALARRLTYPRARGLVVQTAGVANWARRFQRSVRVIPNFVERPGAWAAPGATAGPLRLLAMGRLAPEKGFDLLLEAFARAAPAHPAWSLCILGEGPERPRLERLVERLGLGDRATLPGRVRDPLPWLAGAHAFALSSRYEGFPNALLEAMACGLPVVSFDCPSGPGEVIEHERNGLLVRPGDVDGLAAALGRLLSSPAERERMGGEARRVAERYAPARVLQDWDEVVRGAGGPSWRR